MSLYKIASKQARPSISIKKEDIMRECSVCDNSTSDYFICDICGKVICEECNALHDDTLITTIDQAIDNPKMLCNECREVNNES